MPSNGTATTNGINTITYTPDSGFAYLDTITYKVCLTDNPSLCDSAMMVIYSQPTGIHRVTPDQISVFPNPSDGIIKVTANSPIREVKVYALTGKLLQVHRQDAQNMSATLNLEPLRGLFLLEVTTEKGVIRKKVLIR